MTHWNPTIRRSQTLLWPSWKFITNKINSTENQQNGSFLAAILLFNYALLMSWSNAISMQFCLVHWVVPLSFTACMSSSHNLMACWNIYTKKKISLILEHLCHFCVINHNLTKYFAGSFTSSSLPNGIDRYDYKIKNCLSPEEIIEKYKEVVLHYSKVRVNLVLIKWFTLKWHINDSSI